jgi:hypothetical protein
VVFEGHPSEKYRGNVPIFIEYPEKAHLESVLVHIIFLDFQKIVGFITNKSSPHCKSVPVDLVFSICI